MDFTQLTFAVGRITPQHVALLGTGFLVSKNGLVVTTRHVIGDDDNGLCVLLPKTRDIDTYQDTTDASCKPVNATLKEVDPIRDLAILSTGLSFQGGNLPRLGSFDDTRVGDVLCIWGFPHAPEGRWVLTVQNTIVGAKILLGSQGLKLKHAIINTQAHPRTERLTSFRSKERRNRRLIGGCLRATRHWNDCPRRPRPGRVAPDDALHFRRVYS